MKLLTEDAVLLCNHKLGKVANVPSQAWVTVESRRVLVRPDPEHRSIKGCPELPPVSKPCTSTLNVRAGYSEYVRVDGQEVCLDDLTGLTDGNPPGVANYAVAQPGQPFVAGDA
jgi:hypothetical protein